MPMTDKPFDCVRLMRQLREQIDRDVQDMTDDQRREYIRRRAERFWAYLAKKERPGPVAARG